MGLFKRQIKNGKEVTPTWFMRQAGRYHDHYQGIRSKHDFITMCKDSDLATEITMGPIDEFHFDAAILFSDLLFPLEQLGMGLEYSPGPKLDWHIHSLDDLSKLKTIESANTFYNFQKQALINLKEKLPEHVTLQGFVGGPFTLYAYATEGSHAGHFVSAKTGLFDGRFEGFVEKLYPELMRNIEVQIEGKADVICLLDTAAGELSQIDFKNFVAPLMNKIAKEVKEKYPQIKLTYFAKAAPLSHYRWISPEYFDILGVDWRVDIKDALNLFGDNFYIQGNLDPIALYLPWEKIEKKLEHLWSEICSTGKNHKWIMGLGHGVTPKTPQDHVKKVVSYVHENFHYPV